MEEYNYLFKFIVIGDVNVGKSSLLLQFTESNFKSDYESTIGVEFGSKIINLGDQSIKVQVWDTAGQESYRSIIRSYYKGCSGVMLVFDLTNPKSFENVESWMEEIRDHSERNIEKILLGNKSDLPNRYVKHEDAQTLANSLGLEYLETSAMTGKNVEFAFSRLCELIYQKIKSGELNPHDKKYGIRVGGQSMPVNEDGLAPLLGEMRKSKGCCC